MAVLWSFTDPACELTSAEEIGIGTLIPRTDGEFPLAEAVFSTISQGVSCSGRKIGHKRSAEQQIAHSGPGVAVLGQIGAFMVLTQFVIRSEDLRSANLGSVLPAIFPIISRFSANIHSG
jgi:hypothetical protein